MESQIQLSSELEGRELGGLAPLPWSPAGMPGMWLLSFLACVSEGVSSPIPITAPPLVLIAVSFNPLRFHEEEAAAASISCPRPLLPSAAHRALPPPKEGERCSCSGSLPGVSQPPWPRLTGARGCGSQHCKDTGMQLKEVRKICCREMA